jgi:hypothetical protein
MCVRTGGDACATDAECEGLVCEAGRCAACTETGARACDGDALCAPNGACLDPSEADALAPGQVRGGAFECAARGPNGPTASWPASLLLALVLASAVRLRRRSS